MAMDGEPAVPDGEGIGIHSTPQPDITGRQGATGELDEDDLEAVAGGGNSDFDILVSIVKTIGEQSQLFNRGLT